jgi:hypothetical protein
MSIKYTNIYQCENLQSLPKITIFGLNYLATLAANIDPQDCIRRYFAKNDSMSTAASPQPPFMPMASPMASPMTSPVGPSLLSTSALHPALMLPSSSALRFGLYVLMSTSELPTVIMLTTKLPSVKMLTLKLPRVKMSN